MATTKEIQAAVLEPMQRLWEAPKDFSEEDRHFQVRELTQFCRVYAPEQLLAALKHLEANYPYQSWPRIADWHKALLATLPPKRPDAKEWGWDARRRQASAIFNRTFAKTPLADEMDYLLVLADYSAAMKQTIMRELAAGNDGENAVLGGDYLSHLRKKGQAFRDAKNYQATEAFQAIHAPSFHF